MPVPTFSGLPPFPEFEDVINKINTLVNEMRNLLLNLDTLNIAELNAEVIIAGTVTADKITVNQLSALSADLGHITAGLIEAVTIIGSIIMTNEPGVYPRAEMSNTDNMFKVERSATRNAIFTPSNIGSDAPALRFRDDDKYLQVGANVGTGGHMGISTNERLYIGGGEGNYLAALNYFASWSALMNMNNNKTLAEELSSLSSAINGLSSSMATAGISTGLSGGHNHGIPEGTELMTAGGGTVTFSWAPQHSHAQRN